MDLTFKIIALAIYFLAMLGIGLYAFRKTSDGDEYILGGRQLHPFTAALSAGASDMSGWLLMGLPGALYISGLVESWIAVGLTVGAALNWWLVAPRLRQYTAIANNSLTVPSFFGNRLHDRTRVLRIAAGVVILVFFTFYVSSGMVAGGVFFESMFGGSYLTGMLLVAGITILYTMFGGFLGATYTDVVQGMIMLVSLAAVPIAAMLAVGGPGAMWESIQQVNADFTSMTGGATAIGVISSLAWGLGYFGQPHIIVRFMALRSSRDAKYGLVVGIGWMILCVVGAIFTAMAGLAYFQQHQDAVLTNENGESVFLDLAQILFHPLIAGLLLAAVLAAIMSTLSSQLVVSSSALVEDILEGVNIRMGAGAKLWAGRLGVLAVSLLAVILALNPKNSILDLVSFAWAGFGAAFGPIVLLSLFWRRMTTAGAFVGMVAGALTAFWWGGGFQTIRGIRQVVPFDEAANLFNGEHLYEIVPGFLICLVLAVLVSLITPKPPVAVTEEFDEMVASLKDGVVPAHRLAPSTAAATGAASSGKGSHAAR
ncbi:sodium/proline symporter PutP [Brachybacterium sp. JHP9]|uniref:Sodium/proline symporter n=1 Tax=Brachybacterium equifaecis TaxID=2910770 RepID=A0ABT0QZR1_9MICO|nr:sodium/proline symporter PutP [Brachybacterium equifaecis]MCL6423142.1 sodium/proline symporter PutP [Brachybacterium equifaecis]